MGKLTRTSAFLEWNLTAARSNKVRCESLAAVEGDNLRSLCKGSSRFSKASALLSLKHCTIAPAKSDVGASSCSSTLHHEMGESTVNVAHGLKKVGKRGMLTF